MRFTPILTATLACFAQAAPFTGNGAETSTNVEKRGVPPAVCLGVCWESCLLPTTCAACIVACSAFTGPVEEFKPPTAA